MVTTAECISDVFSTDGIYVLKPNASALMKFLQVFLGKDVGVSRELPCMRQRPKTYL